MASYGMSIDPGKVREFAKATRAADPAYLRGHGAPIPPTFLTTAQLTWSDNHVEVPWDVPAMTDGSPTAIDLDFTRVLHAEEEFVFHGPPPRAGQELVVTMRLGEQYEKQGRRGGTLRFAVIVNEFRDPEGTLVAEQRTTLVETGHAPVAAADQA